jgi:hypothetical protein
MKLEFLDTGSPDHPLIRLSHFTPGEANRLHAAIVGLSSGRIQHIELHCIPGVESLESCRLTLSSSNRDEGIVRKGWPADFACQLTQDMWDNVAGLVEPFTQHANGFQWLVGAPEEGGLLISVDGQW